MACGEHVSGIIDEECRAALFAADGGRLQRACQRLRRRPFRRPNRHPRLRRRRSDGREDSYSAKQDQASKHHVAPCLMTAMPRQFTMLMSAILAAALLPRQFLLLLGSEI
jgi:hypothetical protein